MTGIDRVTGKLLTPFESACQGVEVALTTAIGQRVMVREFGAGVLELLGRLVNMRLFNAYRQLLATAIDLWEPRFKVRRISLNGTVEEVRLGHIGLVVEVDFRPRGHLGDFTIDRVAQFSLTFDGAGLKALP